MGQYTVKFVSVLCVQVGVQFTRGQCEGRQCSNSQRAEGMVGVLLLMRLICYPLWDKR